MSHKLPEKREYYDWVEFKHWVKDRFGSEAADTLNDIVNPHDAWDMLTNGSFTSLEIQDMVEEPDMFQLPDGGHELLIELWEVLGNPETIEFHYWW